MADRFDKPWGTREEVEAAWRAGWDIESGPPPNPHTLPPENSTEATNLRGEAFKHNGVEPDPDARPLIINDTYLEPGDGEGGGGE